jgi:hypothetical protein
MPRPPKSGSGKFSQGHAAFHEQRSPREPAHASLSQLQLPGNCPDVNGFFIRNRDQLVRVGFAQWVVYELLKDRTAFLAACRTPAGALSARLIGQVFAAAVGTISWSKKPGEKRFFESSWLPSHPTVTPAMGCCMDNASMLGLVHQYKGLNIHKLQEIKNVLSATVHRNVLSKINPRSERSCKTHQYLLVHFLIDRINLESGMYSRCRQDTLDGVHSTAAVAVSPAQDAGVYTDVVEVRLVSVRVCVCTYANMYYSVL